MEGLLLKYSASEIVVFVVILALAIKELVTLIDWANARLHKEYDKGYRSEQEKETSEKKVEALDKLYSQTSATFDKINKQIDMLIESDKEDIKAYIVREHHYFVYVKGWIDDYSLECVERRFAVYRQEHGNSFIEGLMNEIRTLPKQPPVAEEDKYADTAKYVRNASKGH